MSEMDQHAEILPRLVAYHDGALSEADREAMDAHVATCALCRRKLADWRALDGAVVALPQAEQADPGILFRALSQIREDTENASAPVVSRGKSRWIYGAVAAAAVFLFAVVTTVMWQSEKPVSMVQQTPKPDADARERAELPSQAMNKSAGENEPVLGMTEAPAEVEPREEDAAPVAPPERAENQKDFAADVSPQELPSSRRSLAFDTPSEEAAPKSVLAGDSGIPQSSDWPARLFTELHATAEYRRSSDRPFRLAELNLLHEFNAEFVGVSYAMRDLLSDRFDATHTTPEEWLTPEPQQLSPENSYLVSNLRIEHTALLARTREEAPSADMALRMAEVTWRLANLTADRDDVNSAMSAQRLAVRYNPDLESQSNERMSRLQAMID